jgi:phosphoglycerate dehydrogenase-like enzyme
VPDEAWRKADAILLWHDVTLDSAAMAKLDRCRVIVRFGVGVDNVDLAAAAARGICVCNVPDYGTNDVADHTIALLLALCRGLFGYDAAARQGMWSWESVENLHRLTGAVLGIIGLGRIGTAAARRAQAHGMRVVFYDPYKEYGYGKALGVDRVSELPALLRQVEAVSVHVPLTDETRGMVGEEFTQSLKPGAVLINTSRGATMDLDAVERALRSGQLRGAGLDVLPQEPPDPNHPLIKAWREQEPWLLGRLIITPHAAFYNTESYIEMRTKAAREALRVLNGARPRNCVNEHFLRSLP